MVKSLRQNPDNEVLKGRTCLCYMSGLLVTNDGPNHACCCSNILGILVLS